MNLKMLSYLSALIVATSIFAMQPQLTPQQKSAALLNALVSYETTAHDDDHDEISDLIFQGAELSKQNCQKFSSDLVGKTVYMHEKLAEVLSCLFEYQKVKNSKPVDEKYIILEKIRARIHTGPNSVAIKMDDTFKPISVRSDMVSDTVHALEQKNGNIILFSYEKEGFDLYRYDPSGNFLGQFSNRKGPNILPGTKISLILQPVPLE